MKSFWNRNISLFAVVLAAGGIGAVVELQAAPSGQSSAKTKSIDASSADGSAFALIADNSNGTAIVIASAFFPDGSVLSGFVFGTPVFSVTNNIMPGHSAKGSFSGAGHATLDGAIYDPSGMPTPVVIGVTITVTDTDNSSAFLQQGVFPITDFFTGETFILRQHLAGNQAFGFTAGSISLSADGTVLKESTGGWGNISSFNTHSIQRLR